MREQTTWRKLMATELGSDKLIAVAPDDSVLDVEFYSGYGGAEGPEFLAWTETDVYFPVVYDGAEWVGSAPRNPQALGQPHVGGQ